MNLGIFLSSGESFKDLSKTGQENRFKKLYLTNYAKHFEKVFVFTYDDEKVTNLPKNVFIVPNKYHLNRYVYGLTLPIVNISIIKKCHIFRIFHLTGTIPGIMARVLFNKPYVYNFAFDYQGTAFLEKKWFQAVLIAVLKPIANQLANHVLAANQQVLKSLPRKKTTLIPNGVDIDLFKPGSSRKISQKLRILSVGRLTPVKNYDSLITALKGLNVELLLVGQGELKGKLKKLAKKDSVKLFIKEMVDNLKLPKVYQSSHIFILPSLSEGSPKVLLEAMACGLPVIGAEVKGIKEIINQKNGLLCKTDALSIREKVINLIEMPSVRSTLGKEARLFIEKKYDFKKILDQEIKILKSI
jgi:glycosyltransferase involved in cell wall biosynthesis